MEDMHHQSRSISHSILHPLFSLYVSQPSRLLICHFPLCVFSTSVHSVGAFCNEFLPGSPLGPFIVLQGRFLHVHTVARGLGNRSSQTGYSNHCYLKLLFTQNVYDDDDGSDNSNDKNGNNSSSSSSNNDNNNNDNSNDDDDDDTERPSLRLFLICSWHQKLSPKCTIKWPRCNHGYITCNTSGVHYVEHILCKGRLRY